MCTINNPDDNRTINDHHHSYRPNDNHNSGPDPSMRHCPPVASSSSPTPTTTTTPAADPPSTNKKIPYTGLPTENPNDTVVPGKMRSDREELPEGFTKEQADQAEIFEAELLKKKSMQRGMNALAAPTDCMPYWPTQFQVCGEIRVKYDSLGGSTSFLGPPSANDVANPDNYGRRQTFWNGPIYWSPATGAHPVVNSFLNRWGVHQYEAGRLRYPTTDEIVLPDGGRRQEFQQGAIYVAIQNAIGSAIFNGPLRDKYNAVGGLTPGSSFLGYPTEDQRGLPDGQGQMDRFQKGVIYWHPQYGAHPISGVILSDWQMDGFETGKWGYPVSDEVDIPSGRAQDFQRGQIDYGIRTSASAPVAKNFYDCYVDLYGPATNTRTTWMNSVFSIRCADPKQRVYVTIKIISKNVSGAGSETVRTKEQGIDGSYLTNNQFGEVNNSAYCQNSQTYRTRVDFTVTNADGGTLQGAIRSANYDEYGCRSKPANCPQIASQADCEAATTAFLYPVAKNWAAYPGLAGGSIYNNSTGALPTPIGQYREYDIYPRRSNPDGSTPGQRIVIDTGGYGTNSWYSPDHYVSFTNFNVPRFP
ncbi:ribonuclease domain-containing protein [Rhodococcus sp. 1R11]|uniref:ribonuclease domain-containing protein n=1 Tax=Rhodococcus sp. 1R11 TaxID=2559614 RepID=UPI0014306BAD|nr:ribonuclease domain-containing protein [Rhodococcus sp. 1R11]